MLKPTNEEVVLGLLRQVGERVRKARESKGFTRKHLSHISGVSNRYLAQLEAGDGNISIGLLQRLALALDYNIDWFVRSDAAPHPSFKAHRICLRICLLGLRGAGKSTLGQQAGERLGVPFIELNHRIEAAAGMPLGDIIALYGPEGYRQLEATALKHLIDAQEPMIVAVAGGIVTESETFAQLLKHFHTIWLKASPEEHMARVQAQGDMRPMAGNPKAMAQLRAILTSREALYGQADQTLDTSGQSCEQAVSALLNLIEQA